MPEAPPDRSWSLEAHLIPSFNRERAMSTYKLSAYDDQSSIFEALKQKALSGRGLKDLRMGCIASMFPIHIPFEVGAIR
jgi:hypothetical protein